MAKRKFSASSAAQLMQCPGSADLELAIPGWKAPVVDETKGAKGVGTNLHDAMKPFGTLYSSELEDVADVLHEWALLHWTKRRPMCKDLLLYQEWVDKSAPAVLPSAGQVLMKILPTLEMVPPSLIHYVADVAEELARLFGNNSISVWSRRCEESLEATWLQQPVNTTPDFIMFVHQDQGLQPQLIVVDYKTGKIPVSAANNDQLRYYALTAIIVHGLKGLSHITYGILQPDNMDWQEDTADELKAWGRQALLTEQRILNDDVTLVPGKSCTFCPANPHTRGDRGTPLCPAMMEMLYPSNVDMEEIFG